MKQSPLFMVKIHPKPNLSLALLKWNRAATVFAWIRWYWPESELLKNILGGVLSTNMLAKAFTSFCCNMSTWQMNKSLHLLHTPTTVSLFCFGKVLIILINNRLQRKLQSCKKWEFSLKKIMNFPFQLRFFFFIFYQPEEGGHFNCCCPQQVSREIFSYWFMEWVTERNFVLQKVK